MSTQEKQQRDYTGEHEQRSCESDSTQPSDACDTSEAEYSEAFAQAEEMLPVALSHVGRRWGQYMQTIRDRRDAGYVHAPTGLPSLDLLLNGGLPPGQLTILAAQPGIGKTSYALSLAIQWAVRTSYKRPALVWSLELSEEDLYSRIVCLIARQPWARIRAGECMEACEATGAELAECPLYACTDRTLHMDSLHEAVEWLTAKYGETPMLIIDYIQRVTPGDTPDARLEINGISDDLLKITQDFNCITVAISSVGRASYNVLDEKEGTPDLDRCLAVAKESGQLEFDAAVVLTLVRQPKGEDEDEEKRAWIVLAKNRLGGGRGYVACEYDGQSGWYSEIEDTTRARKKRDYKAEVLAAVKQSVANGGGIASKQALALCINARKADVVSALSHLMADGRVTFDLKRKIYTAVW